MKLQYLFLPLILWAGVGFLLFSVPPSNFLIIVCVTFFFNLSVGLTLHLFMPKKVALIIPLVLFLGMMCAAFSAISLINFVLIGAIGLLTWLIL